MQYSRKKIRPKALAVSIAVEGIDQGVEALEERLVAEVAEARPPPSAGHQGLGVDPRPADADPSQRAAQPVDRPDPRRTTGVLPDRRLGFG